VLGAGTHTLEIEYTGRDTLESSATTVELPVAGQPTTTVVGLVDDVVYGTSFEVTVDVTAQIDGTPEGEVTVTVGGVTASSTLENGTAAVRLPGTVAAGTHDIVAIYAGSSGHNASTSAPVPVTVTPAAARLVVTPPGDGTYGTETTVSVGVSSATGATAAGQVALQLDGTTVDEKPLSRGEASLTLPATAAVGVHTLTVVYSGSANISSESSAPITWRQRTGPPVVALTLDAASVPLAEGDSAHVTATLEATGDGTTALSYRLTWGDGTAEVTGTYTGTLALEHDYTTAGRYIVRVETSCASR